MAIGLNRHNDTPIGGLPEFRGNMQSGEVFNVDNVPAWDGEKFSPASNSALLNGYGGGFATILPTAPGGESFTVGSMSFSVKRIG